MESEFYKTSVNLSRTLPIEPKSNIRYNEQNLKIPQKERPSW